MFVVCRITLPLSKAVPSFYPVDYELQNVEIAIELDKGKSVAEVAEQFGVSERLVKAVAKKIGGESAQTKTAKSRRFTEIERELLAGRIGAGEDLEEIAAETGVTENTLRRWCKQRGVPIPRKLEQVSLAEREEIREMLEEQNQQEVARAYNLSSEAVESLSEAEYKQLDTGSLSFLFELLREQPRASAAKLSGFSRQAGLEIPESVIRSYRKRLQSLNVA